MKTYPYPTPDGITQLVEESEYNRLKWELEESKAKHAADVVELNARLAQQQADMLDTIVKLRAELTSWQSLAERLAMVLQQVKDSLYAPDPNCRCHISPPCNDCVDYSETRENISIIKQALAAYESAKSGNLPDPLAEAVKRMEEVPYVELNDGKHVTVGVADGLDRIRARLISAAKGEHP